MTPLAVHLTLFVVSIIFCSGLFALLIGLVLDRRAGGGR